MVMRFIMCPQRSLYNNDRITLVIKQKQILIGRLNPLECKGNYCAALNEVGTLQAVDE